MKQAYGFMEAEGLTAAVTASDIALKAANVSLMGLELARGFGYTVVKLTGDVAAVKAAVDACSFAPELSGKLVSVTVIPRPADELDKVVITEDNNWLVKKSPKEEPPEEGAKEAPEKEREEETPKPEVLEEPSEEEKEDEEVEISEEAPKEETSEEEKSSKKAAPVKETKVFKERKFKTPEELQEMRVMDLRKLARTIPVSIPRREIKFANKEELTESISEYYKEKGLVPEETKED